VNGTSIATSTITPPALPATDAMSLLTVYASRELSPVEACKAYLDRIEALEPSLHTFVHLDRQRLLADAHEAERKLVQSSSAALDEHPLLGVPVAIKDMIDVAGMPTTCHSKILLGNIARADADCTGRLRRAGALIMGKLATHEFARGGPAFDLPFEPARNPWNPTHHPGGSSSGAGAGVAAGLFPLAIGTDTGGSVRHPAAACGIAGFKPSYDRVSRAGVFPLSPTLDHVGPLARRVCDLALAFEAMDAGNDAPWPERLSFCRSLRECDANAAAGARIGYLRRFHMQDVPASPEICAGIDSAAATFAELGAHVEEVDTVALTDYFDVNRVILHAEAWQIHQHWLRERPSDYAAATRRGFFEGSFYSAADYLDAMRCRQLLKRHIASLFDRYDFLICGSSLHLPCAIDDGALLAKSYSMQARVLFNLSGDPALGLMCGLSPDKLPLSFQLAAKYGRDRALLRLGAAYENATPWKDVWPPLALFAA
jgi:aspartyl-tRNA(Asn)/glutamyl-tRNA(Gln) amidotransferase subunit A